MIMDDITITLETIDPAKARAYLLHSDPKNRTLRASTIEKYKQDIIDGKWQITHQGIAFDTDGVLTDGHHRLTAIMLSGQAVKCFVARNVPKEARKVIDGGVSRSMNDRLRINGCENPVLMSTNVCAVITRIYKTLIAKKTNIQTSLDKSEELYNRWKYVFDTLYSICVCVPKDGSAIKNRYTMAAVLAAMVNGISEQRVRAFVKCLCTKEIDEAIFLGCNYKAALKYEIDYEHAKANARGTCGSKYEELFATANRAIYCFSTGKSRTTLSVPYEITLENLDWLERRLEEKERVKL